MSKPPSAPDEPADEERGGTALLARVALGAPAPPPGAERESRERVLAQFRSGTLSPRALREEAEEEAGGTPRPSGWAERLARALRRMRGR